MPVYCQDITIRYKRKEILSDLNLDFPDGQINALYGPSGSGKTALLMALAGKLKPAAGVVQVNGLDITGRPDKAQGQIGLGVIQEFNPLFKQLTVEENLLFRAQGLRLSHPRQAVAELIRGFELENIAKQRADSLPALKSAETCLAIALLNDPGILLLDQPEYGLTTEQTALFWVRLTRLKQKGKNIILTTRYHEVAARCDQTVIMPQGKVVDSGALTKYCFA